MSALSIRSRHGNAVYRAACGRFTKWAPGPPTPKAGAATASSRSAGTRRAAWTAQRLERTVPAAGMPKKRDVRPSILNHDHDHQQGGSLLCHAGGIAPLPYMGGRSISSGPSTAFLAKFGIIIPGCSSARRGWNSVLWLIGSAREWYGERRLLTVSFVFSALQPRTRRAAHSSECLC